MKKAYKLFKLKKGKLYPLYVLADKEIEVGKWLPAENGPITAKGKVKSKLGELCYRPGWHLSDIPLAKHIGIKENGEIKYMHDDEVWCECYFNDEVDYTEAANKNGTINGKLNKVRAYLREIPRNGFYRFKTSPNMLGEWIIAGEMMVKRILSDEEVAEICGSFGYEALPRKIAIQ